MTFKAVISPQEMKSTSTHAKVKARGTEDNQVQCSDLELSRCMDISAYSKLMNAVL